MIPPSGRDRAYTFVKKEILTDPARQGTFINEQVLADQIGVSRTPIREALLMLAAQDLVQLVPKRGAYIAPMTNRELRDLVGVRLMIEQHAAMHVSDFKNIAYEMQEALTAQDFKRRPAQAKEFIELDTRFHTALVRAAGNEMLTKMYEGLRDRQVTAGLVALSRSSRRQDEVLAEHSAIVAALIDANVPAALAAIEKHLSSTLRVQLTA
ncbi:GntR family transcriptional regulator [Actinocrispum wychmicini]|uniref:DNA-binding GntR family transcriptional regulator n=1 Tax=Actinocrispum wychmicini TaxID=1213861 RepID=A0A4R2JWT0_9PSEU|nr:GntR family transcriptional regulator [Actinocrispum wychmicini]TCO64294.1 DNA-binding GntR family transcriptional regulator [Actinocrispum wychmicini]